MVTIEELRKTALSFPETSEQPHFEKPSFRIGKKIFATVDLQKNQACVKLSPKDQDLFAVAETSIIFPVPNKWGQQGWTFVDLEKVTPILFLQALKTAYCEAAPKKLAAQMQSDLGTD